MGSHDDSNITQRIDKLEINCEKCNRNCWFRIFLAGLALLIILCYVPTVISGTTEGMAVGLRIVFMAGWMFLIGLFMVLTTIVVINVIRRNR